MAEGGNGGGFDWRLLLQAISSAIPHYAQYQANKRQQAAIDRGVAVAEAKRNEGEAMLGDLVAKRAASNAEPEKVQAQQGYDVALRAAQAQAGASRAPVGGKAYRADTQAAGSETRSYGNERAGYLARMDAPFRQRQAENVSSARAGVNLSRMANEAQTADYLARLKANAISPNPWVMMLAKIGQQIAGNYQTAEETPNDYGLLSEIDTSGMRRRQPPADLYGPPRTR